MKSDGLSKKYLLADVKKRDGRKAILNLLKTKSPVKVFVDEILRVDRAARSYILVIQELGRYSVPNTPTLNNGLLIWERHLDTGKAS